MNPDRIDSFLNRVKADPMPGTRMASTITEARSLARSMPGAVPVWSRSRHAGRGRPHLVDAVKASVAPMDPVTIVRSAKVSALADVIIT